MVSENANEKNGNMLESFEVLFVVGIVKINCL